MLGENASWGSPNLVAILCLTKSKRSCWEFLSDSQGACTMLTAGNSCSDSRPGRAQAGAEHQARS